MPTRSRRQYATKYRDPTDSEIEEEFSVSSFSEDESETADDSYSTIQVGYEIERILQKKVIQNCNQISNDSIKNQDVSLAHPNAIESNLSNPANKYLVKWKNKSYLHVSWETANSLKNHVHDRRHIEHHISKFDSQPAMMDEEIRTYQRIHRIIDILEKESQFFVKWQSLGYEECTWENKHDLLETHCTEELDNKISEYYKRTSNGSFENCIAQAKVYSSDREFRNGKRLRQYQVEAVDWLTYNIVNKRNSILADEMGLGKTCQAIAFVHRLVHALKAPGPFLVIAPLATLRNWLNEFESWTDFNCIVYHGNLMARQTIRTKELSNPFHVIITNYETLLVDENYLRKFRWSLLIVDEAHKLKNSNSKICISLRENLNWAHCLLLTGTPIQNSIRELWSMLNFIDSDGFSSLSSFEKAWGNMTSAKQLESFNNMLRQYMLRRIKTEVEELPTRNERLVEVELTALQKRFYRAIYERNYDHLRDSLSHGSRVNLNNIAMQLRKVCCHPFLLEGAEEQALQESNCLANESEILKNLIRASGKLIFLDRLLPKLKSEGHRVLIFSQMTRMLDILEDYMIARKISYERIDGSVSGTDRQSAIDRFSSKESNAFCFLLSTRGCGQGINLTAADTIVMYDGDWNPQNDLQALARCHRIGQKKEVNVYKIITRKTYEEVMFHTAARKLGLDQAIMSRITTGDCKTRNSQKTKKELDRESERLLKHGAFSLSDDDKEAIIFEEQDIDSMLETRSKRISTKEGNFLARATFKSSLEDENVNLQIDDPDFWMKFVGLKKQKRDKETFYEGPRSKRRRSINYNENLLAQDRTGNRAEQEKLIWKNKTFFKYAIQICKGLGPNRLSDIQYHFSKHLELSLTDLDNDIQNLLNICIQSFQIEMDNRAGKSIPQSITCTRKILEREGFIPQQTEYELPASAEAQSTSERGKAEETLDIDCTQKPDEAYQRSIDEMNEVLDDQKYSYLRAFKVMLCKGISNHALQHFGRKFPYLTQYIQSTELSKGGREFSRYETTVLVSSALSILKDFDRMCFLEHVFSTESQHLDQLKFSLALKTPFHWWSESDDVKLLKALNKHGWFLGSAHLCNFDKIIADSEFGWREEINTKSALKLLKTRALHLYQEARKKIKSHHEKSKWSKSEKAKLVLAISKFGLPDKEEKHFSWTELYNMCALPRKGLEEFRDYAQKIEHEARMILSGKTVERPTDAMTEQKAKTLVNTVINMKLLREQILHFENLESVLQILTNKMKGNMPSWWTYREDVALLRLIPSIGMNSPKTVEVIKQNIHDEKNRKESYVHNENKKYQANMLVQSCTDHESCGGKHGQYPKYSDIMKHCLRLIHGVLHTQNSLGKLSQEKIAPEGRSTLKMKTVPIRPTTQQRIHPFFLNRFRS